MVRKLSNGQVVGAAVDIYEGKDGHVKITLTVMKPGSAVWDTAFTKNFLVQEDTNEQS
jgi:hypothetical protein